MKLKRRTRVHVPAAHIVSTISVTMVLAVLGLVALMGILIDRAGKSLRSEMTAVVMISDMASDGAADSLAAFLKGAPFVRSAQYKSADEVNAEFIEMLGDDELEGFNPFLAEYDVKVTSDYGSPEALQSIDRQLRQFTAVDDVRVHTEVVRSVNHWVGTLMLVLSVVAVALLIISFVLIVNTVSMEIYARRLLIHTQQYVGAKASFIRRPYVGRASLSGIIAAAVATCLLGSMLLWTRTVSPAIFDSLGWDSLGLVGLGLATIGAFLSGAAAWIAVSRYLRRSYDEIQD